MEEAEIPVRHRVLDAITAKPGIHMRELERLLGVSLSGITHHARILESEGHIVGISDGHYRRYFLSALVLPSEARRLTDIERKLLAACKRPTPLTIILNLAVDGPLRHRDLEQRLGRAKGTVSYHLSRLADQGIVSAPSSSAVEGYRLADPSRVISLLVTFSGALRDHVDGFANLWLLLGRKSP